MKDAIQNYPLLAFIGKNWFKITVVLLGIYLFFIKQMSFQVHVETQENTRQQVRKPLEKITENSTAVAGISDQLERLEIPFITSGRKSRNALAELNDIEEDVRHDYLRRFAKTARQEQEKFDIPASVILAVSLLQSSAGRHPITQDANNHFALPCSSDWRSACHSNDGNSYRKYESAWFSFRDFSKYLDANFVNLRGGNYQNYANALQENGFGDDERIGEHIIQVIEEYGLKELDR